MRLYRSLPSRHQDYPEPANDSSFVDRTSSRTEESRESNSKECIEDIIGENSKDANEAIERRNTPNNERTKREQSISKLEEKVSSADCTSKIGKRVEAEQENSPQEQSISPRISLIKPPRILAKFISPDAKLSPAKHGERKSNIPILKRSSKEFEDIRSPQESPKRSLIPLRYVSSFLT